MLSWTKQRGPIGLDIGTHSIKAAALDAGGELVAFAQVPRESSGPLGLPEASRLVRVLDQRGLVGDRVIVATPRDMLMTAVLELPPRSSGAPVEQIAADELAKLHSTTSSDLTMHLRDLPKPVRGGESLQAIALGVRTDAAHELLRVLGEAGLDPMRIETSGSALLRGAELDKPAVPSGAARVVVDAGWSSTAIVVATRDGVVSERHIGVGLATIAERAGRDETDRAARRAMSDLAGPTHMARTSGAALIDAFTSELDRVLSFSQSLYGIERLDSLMLAGGGAALLAGALTQDDRVARFNPELSPHPALLTAIGLAAGAMRSGARGAAA
ncbi:MAG: hypothetical protein AAGB51_12000 [Planctomycetota bacterium]